MGVWRGELIAIVIVSQLAMGHPPDEADINISHLDIRNTDISNLDLSGLDFSSVHLSSVNIDDLNIGTLILDSGRKKDLGPFDVLQGKRKKLDKCELEPRESFEENWEVRKFSRMLGVCRGYEMPFNTTASEEQYNEALDEVNRYFSGHNSKGMVIDTFGPVVWSLNNGLTFNPLPYSEFYVCRLLSDLVNENKDDFPSPLNEDVYLTERRSNAYAIGRSYTSEEFMKPCNASVPTTGFTMMDQFRCKAMDLKEDLINDKAPVDKYLDLTVGAMYEIALLKSASRLDFALNLMCDGRSFNGR